MRSSWILVNEVYKFKYCFFLVVIDEFELRIHGTDEKPECYETLPNNNH